MFVSGIVMSPAGVAVASLMDDMLPMPALELAGLPVLALALITISGPPATRAALSRVATTAPAAMGAVNSCQRPTW